MRRGFAANPVCACHVTNALRCIEKFSGFIDNLHLNKTLVWRTIRSRNSRFVCLRPLPRTRHARDCRRPLQQASLHFPPRLILAMSRLIARALLQGRAARCPFTAVTPFFPRARLLPQLHVSLFSTEPSQPVTPEEFHPKKRTPTPLPTKSEDELAQMPYQVGRSPSSQLPVYRQVKSGGTQKRTYIKRVEGDRQKLVQELVDNLNLDAQDVKINPTTNHIEIKVSLTA